MRLLFVIPYVPNQIRVRPYQFIRHLAAAGHEIHLFTLVTGAQDEADAQALRQVCEEVVTVSLPTWRSLVNCGLGLVQYAPLQAVYSWSPALSAQILTALTPAKGSGFDAVHVEHLRGSRYALEIQRALQALPVETRPRLIWDAVDSISLLFRQSSEGSASLRGRWMTSLELGRTERYEGFLARSFEHILVTSQRDQAELVALSGAAIDPAKVRVVPNGVDLDYFHPNPTVEPEPKRIVISGKMSYHANISMVERFVSRIFPRILAAEPDARLCVVGKDPPASIRSLAQNPAIEVTGTVEDIRPYLWRSAVAVAPLAYGVGIQNKVLEAMACGLPVVCSPQAISALSATDGQEVLTADDDAAFAEMVLRLLSDPQWACQIAHAGYDYVNRCHRWDQVVSQLLEIYHESTGDNARIDS